MRCERPGLTLTNARRKRFPRVRKIMVKASAERACEQPPHGVTLRDW